jgi:hypothetical protein
MAASRSSYKKNKKICTCGASGCAIYPGFECGAPNCVAGQCKKPIITKIFGKMKNFENEKRIYDKDNHRLHQLDPEENYFLSDYEPCDPIKKETIEDLHICANLPEIIEEREQRPLEHFSVFNAKATDPSVELDWQNSSSSNRSNRSTSNRSTSNRSSTNQFYNAINLSYLGKPMQKVLPDLNSIDAIKSFLISVENIFQGVKLLNKAGIYHSDIKPPNIVLDDRDKKFKLIDFGQAIFGIPKQKKVDEELTKKIEWQAGDDIEGYTAGFISPEYFYYLQHLPPNVTFFGDAKNFQLRDKKIFFTLKTFTKEKGELQESTEESPIDDDYYKKLDSSKSYTKNDVWSMGCVLKYIRSEMEVKLANTDMQSFLEDIIIGLSEVITKLLILNVDKRPTPSEALAIYKEFIQKQLQPPTGGRKKRTVKAKKGAYIKKGRIYKKRRTQKAKLRRR